MLVTPGGGDAELGACNATGSMWYWYQPPGEQHAQFGNRYQTGQTRDIPMMLSGGDVLGAQFFAGCLNRYCTPDYYQRFDFVSA